MFADLGSGTIIGCPRCEMENGNPQLNCLIYVRQGVASCESHGEMTTEQILTNIAELVRWRTLTPLGQAS